MTVTAQGASDPAAGGPSPMMLTGANPELGGRGRSRLHEELMMQVK